MRRLLPCLVVAQATGIVLADWHLLDVGAASAVGLAALALGGLRRSVRARAAAALGLAFAAGGLALASQLESAGRARPRSAVARTVEGRIDGLRRAAFENRVDLVDVQAVDDGDASPRRLRVAGLDPEAPFVPGMRIRARVRMRPPTALRNPGGRADPRRLERAGVGAIGRLVHPHWIAHRPDADAALRVRLERLRRRLGERLAASGRGGALLRTLALGDGGDLGRPIRDRFAALGISHVLAVSGLHLALVATLVYGLSRRALARSALLAARLDVRDVARLLALLAAAGYALLTGFGVPVRRALVLVVAIAASAARGRRAPSLHALAAAALLVLAMEPEALFSVGAQLSFAACAALLWGVRHFEGAASTRERFLAAARASAIASAVTAPLAALHLGVAAPAAIAANLVAIPWTGFVLLPAALLATAAAAMPEAGVASRVLAIAEWVAALTLDAASGAGAWLPQRSASVPAGWAIALAAGLGIATVRARRVSAAVVLATACSLLLWRAPPASLEPAPPRLVALDVGRGDAIVVQGTGATLLVDAGAASADRFDLGASAVVPALRALGVTHLDLLVVTHADVDHRGGVPAVLRALPVGAVWIPRGTARDPDFAEIRVAAASRATRVLERGTGDGPHRVGDLRVQSLWPPSDADGASRNERSLALRVSRGAHRILLLGDLGRAEEDLLALGSPDDLAADVLVLPHHGSRGSSGRALLDAIAPEVAIVSAPCPSVRSLPHPDALARATRAGASVWWTGRDGAVFVGLGARLTVAPFAARRDCAP